ncbi:MAG: PadR family transcriptional regulator [Candidatus Micrarchaeota archaeon]
MTSTTPIKRLKRLLTIGNLWLYLLSLVKTRKIYAYEMDSLVEKEFSFKPNKIMIYIVLYRLENEGLISSKFEERRKYYTITKDGKETLNSAREYFKVLANKL